jgi:DNA-binding NarL/FixJ family response regulator/protein-S-isoprenylcysteine O-methyltransferase Ste14
VRRRETPLARLTQIAFMGAAFWLLVSLGHMRATMWHARFVPETSVVAAVAIALTLAGVAFSIWARWCLGRNWSAAVTIRQDHELIRRGPYAWIRHPIYTGMLVALLGTALGIGELRALVAFALVLLGFTLRRVARRASSPPSSARRSTSTAGARDSSCRASAPDPPTPQSTPLCGAPYRRPMTEHASAELTAGRDALAQGAWEQARAHFERAIEAGAGAEAHEGVAAACDMLADGNAAIAARERAYALYRERDDPRAAARTAIWLAVDSIDFRYEAAVANGWMQRAERLLEGLPPCYEWGMLRVFGGHLALMAENDTETARTRAAEGRAIARDTASLDLEVLSLGLEGLARVSEGHVREGMRLLDESTVAALGGEVKELVAVGQSCCYLIHACERVRDFDRAGQWCLKVREFCERWRYSTMFTVCRTQYASVLMHRGEWNEAEAELTAALDELRAHRPAGIAPGVVRLAELRRRQGRRDEAAELFETVRTHRMAVLGRGELALDRGDAAAARDLAQQALRRIPASSRTERVGGLDLLARAAARAGAAAELDAAANELESIAAAIDTDPLRALALRARGLAESHRHPERARHAFEDAADLFERAPMPFEAAETHLALARLLAAERRSDAARAASERAATLLQRLGATHDAGEPAMAAGGADAATPVPSPLTTRERDVLSLVAAGLADKEIAARLHLSPHTIHRHVSNILTKLDLPSRAAAVAHAARLGLLK